ncbi:H-type lectin domain-containing protein [Nioella nitratireducens]|uniref:H-type lectin domain-containing protein n=1 Tax=Nioella nitratireducens TaxID=1287720 RepID=UPI0008FD15D2|nr:H-type lectin domain-containing protein [Nioella nitratireducens]
MKTIRNGLVGVDQGSVLMFDDYDTGGEMWTGEGNRQVWHPIRFGQRFRVPPAVHVSVTMWDMSSGSNQRADITATNVRKDGFELVFKTWEDTQIARLRADWMAIGELFFEDDWDVP